MAAIVIADASPLIALARVNGLGWLDVLFAQVLEAVRALQEGVLTDIREGDVGAILGWGFAPFEGGALQFIDARGVGAFVERCRELAARHGPRFEPAGLLVKLAAEGRLVADR